MIRDIITYAVNNLRNRKMRSWLTVLSILIGIAAIFTLVSFGQGLSSYVNGLASKMGTDKIIALSSKSLTSGINEELFFTQDEVNLLGKVKGVAELSPNYLKGVQVTKDKKVVYSFGIGMSTGKDRRLVEEVFTVDIIRGRALKTGDRNKVVLGYNYLVPDKIFKKPVKVGDKLDINGRLFEVVGFFDELGNPSDDRNVYFTYAGFESLFPDLKDRYYQIIMRSSADTVPATVAARAKEKLRKYRGLKEGEENFDIQTFEQALQTFTSIITVINSILLLIALVSLIIAGVNIMNTMYTAVLERTKEIGIMKAVGAQNKDILVIVVVESSLLGVIGGIIGVMLGWGISSLGGKIAAGAGYALLSPVFPLWLILGCIFFGGGIGALAGYFPARSASRLRPVDSLRYE
ncbi:MAG: ABC transporter permease [DPANN group archaeon]|nr:ABC transporter permease [DPANN group archaeon]